MTALQHYQMLIDGQWVDASDGGVFGSVNPTTGVVWALIPEATADDVDRAVMAANHALNNGPWGRMSPTERGHCFVAWLNWSMQIPSTLARSKPSILANCSRRRVGRRSI